MDPYAVIKVLESQKRLTTEELKKIKQDIIEFLDSDAPEEEKALFAPFGYLEMVCMMLDDFY